MESFSPGGKPHILIQIRKQDLAELFEVSIHTLNKWQSQGKVNLRSLQSICELYYSRRLKKEHSLAYYNII